MGLKKTVKEMHIEFQEARKHIENLSESDALSSSVWTIQRKYLNLGKTIIITDLQYALRYMVEQELWNYGFKNFISILQKMSKNEKNSQRSDAQCIFTKALDEAYGFYLNLLDHFCLFYDLKVPFRRNKYMGIDLENNTKKNSDKNFKSLCYFICTHCLVHLGDLDRYRNQLNEAELFYRHAQSVSPTSGHAYNQLALLDVIRSNKLGTVFHYVQAIMCQHPFGPSIPNLFKTLETVHDINITNPYIEFTQEELINIFLYFHKILHSNANAQKRSGLVKFLNLRILAMVATNSFSSSILLQMFVINLFSIDYLKLCPTNDCKSKLSGEQQKAKQDILKLIVGQLDAMLLTNYTITDSLIGNNALPTIKLCFQWISTRSSILNEPAFSEHSKIWKKFCTVLNNLQIVLSDSERSSFPVRYPLPEDVLVQGFSPLEDCLKNLNFTESDNNQRLDSQTEMYLRVARLIELGHRFTSHLVNGAPLIKYVGGQFVVYNDEAGYVENPTIEPEVLDFTNETNQLDERNSQCTTSDCRIIPVCNLSSIGQESNDILRPECSSGRSVEKMPTNDDPMKIEPNHPDSAEGRIRRNPRPFKNVAIHSILNLTKNGRSNEMTRDQDFNSGATPYHSSTKKNYENVEKRVRSLNDCMPTYSPLFSNNTNTYHNNQKNPTTPTKPNYSFTIHNENSIALDHSYFEYLINDLIIGDDLSSEMSYSDIQDDFDPSYVEATSTPTPSIDNEDNEKAYRLEYWNDLKAFSMYFDSLQNNEDHEDNENNEDDEKASRSYYGNNLKKFSMHFNSAEMSVILGHESTNIRKENTRFQLGSEKKSSGFHRPSEHDQNTSVHTALTEKKLNCESNQEAIKEEYRTKKKLICESDQEAIKAEYRNIRLTQCTRLQLESPKESLNPDSSRLYNRNRDLTVASGHTASTENELSFGSIESHTSENFTKVHWTLSIEPTNSNSSSHCDASCEVTDASMHTAWIDSELNRKIIEPYTSKPSIESSNLNSSRRCDRNRELTNVSVRGAAIERELVNECIQEAVRDEYRNVNFTEFYWRSKSLIREENQVYSIQANIKMDSISIINRNNENKTYCDIRVFLIKLVLFELLVHLLLPFLVALAPWLLRFGRKKYDV
ncbi:hypothetical protein TKK_0003730 [Trichogramma kaykai]|uniref:DNA/RNA-binding domain-containing protein n=1 Tax=Trichogramma kaykai TaxID=54128 RepID=A0ABD2XMI5_9HYME